MSASLEDVLTSRNIPYRKNVLTASLSTFAIGGVCPFVVEPRCIGELCDVLLFCSQAALSYAVIGRGSNLLFDDRRLPYVLIRTLSLDALKQTEEGLVTADCGVMLPRLARVTAAVGFADLCFAAGIPGSVGGGVYMNAGAHDKSLGETVKCVTALHPSSGKIKTYFNKELNFCYRKSIFKTNNEIVLQATLQLTTRIAPTAAQAGIKALLAHRAATQPLHLPSAGSAFLRPATGEPMGKILEELGLKGHRCGNAAVSEKHAGFIVNLGGATAQDVLLLISDIQNIVQKERGFRPETEIRYITEKKE